MLVRQTCAFGRSRRLFGKYQRVFHGFPFAQREQHAFLVITTAGKLPNKPRQNIGQTSAKQVLQQVLYKDSCGALLAKQPRKPVTHNHRQLSPNFLPLWVKVAHYYGQLGFLGKSNIPDQDLPEEMLPTGLAREFGKHVCPKIPKPYSIYFRGTINHLAHFW